MKYSFSRTIRLEKYLGSAYAFESASFQVEADTKEEAEKEVSEWIKDKLKRMKENDQKVIK